MKKAFAVTVTLVLLLIPLIAATQAYAITTSGEITGSETWSGTVHLTGDVTVTGTGSLTVMPGTRVECAWRSDDQIDGINTSRIELIVDQGTLNASGAEANPILFTAAAPSPAKGDWYGLRINSTNAVLQYCVVEYGKEGLRIEGGVPTVERSTFQENEISGIRLGVSADISHCVSTSNGMGIYVDLNQTLNLIHSTVSNNSGKGIGPGAELGPLTRSVIIADCEVGGNGGTGVDVWGGTAQVSQSSIHNNGGGGVNAGPWGSATVEDGTITGNGGDGIYAGQGTATVRRSTIARNGRSGIDAFWNGGGTIVLEDSAVTHNSLDGLGGDAPGRPAGAATVRYSAVADNGANGIYAATVAATGSVILRNGQIGICLSTLGAGGIAGCYIRHNQIGIVTESSAARLDLTASNDIFDNKQYELWNNGSAAVVADGEFWGEPTTSELTTHQYNLTKIWDSRDDPSVGQVAIRTWATTPFRGAADVATIKLRADETPVVFRLAAVTASFGDCFYIEEYDRSCGIRVLKPGHVLMPGMCADLSGVIRASPEGERYVDATAASQNGSGNRAGILDPLAMANRTLGGGDWRYQEGTGEGQKGVAGGLGLNNIGLLVTIWGEFTKTSDTTFTLDDGSGTPVNCVVPSGVTLSPLWNYAVVTGISSCENIGEELHRLLRVRTQNDITPY